MLFLRSATTSGFTTGPHSPLESLGGRRLRECSELGAPTAAAAEDLCHARQEVIGKFAGADGADAAAGGAAAGAASGAALVLLVPLPELIVLPSNHRT